MTIRTIPTEDIFLGKGGAEGGGGRISFKIRIFFLDLDTYKKFKPKSQCGKNLIFYRSKAHVFKFRVASNG